MAPIRSKAIYDYEWTSGALTPVFPKWRYNPEDDTITYFGDALKLQNGLGNLVVHTYYCRVDTFNERVLAIDVSPGRLR